MSAIHTSAVRCRLCRGDLDFDTPPLLGRTPRSRALLRCPWCGVKEPHHQEPADPAGRVDANATDCSGDGRVH